MTSKFYTPPLSDMRVEESAAGLLVYEHEALAKDALQLDTGE